jgi:hypothetical protein
MQSRTAVTMFCDQQPAGDMVGGAADFMDQRTRPFLVLHAREQAERYLARLSTSTVPAGWRSLRIASARDSGAAITERGQSTSRG